MDDSKLPPPISVRDLTLVLRRRWVLAATTFVLTVGGVVVLTKRITPTYESSTRVLVENSTNGGGGSVSSVLDLLSAGSASNASLDTEMEKILTISFAEKLRKEAGLPGDMSLEYLKTRLVLSPGKGGQILNIAARADNAPLAQKMANTAAKLYLDMVRADAQERNARSLERLTAATEIAKKDKDEKQALLQRFNRAMRASDPNAIFRGRAERLLVIQAQLEDARKQAAILEESLAAATRQLRKLPTEQVAAYNLNKDPVIDGYKTEIAAKKAERNIKLMDFQEDSLEIQQIDKEIRAREKAIADAEKTPYSVGSKSVGRNPDYQWAQSEQIHTQASLEVARRTIRESEEMFARLQREQVVLADKQMTELALQTEFAAASEAYRTALTGLIAARLRLATDLPNTRILDPASLPTQPLSPRPLLNAILAGFFGVFLGVGLALLAEYFSARPEAQPAFYAPDPLGLPMAAGVPILGTTAPLTLSSKSSLRDEDALREIGYTLAHRELGQSAPIRLLLGTRSDETTAAVALQVARTLASDGLRITLIDVDRLRPRLQTVGAAPNLTVVDGSDAARSEESLRRLLDSQSDHTTDLILLSGPAVWNVPAALPLVKATGGVVLVASGDAPLDESVARARRLLTNGFVPQFHGVVAVTTLPAIAALEETS